ncbi:MAG: DUF998 domain-containing protein [Candidatus Helarchaeota archaeon]
MLKEQLITDDYRKYKRICCLLIWICTCLFVFFTGLAMFVYYPVYYSFINNYFSELGRIISFEFILRGQIHLISPTLWIVSVAINAISFALFWSVFKTLFTEAEKMKKYSTAGTITGIISSFFFIAVAVFPLDIYGLAHIIAGYGFFVLFAISVILYSIAIFFNEKYKDQDVWKFHLGRFKRDFNIRHIDKTVWGRFRIIYGFIVSALAVFYVVAPFLQPLFQKIAVYNIILWMVIQSYWAWNVIGPGPDSIDRITMLEYIMKHIIENEMKRHLDREITLNEAILNIIAYERMIINELKHKYQYFQRLKSENRLEEFVSSLKLKNQE